MKIGIETFSSVSTTGNQLFYANKSKILPADPVLWSTDASFRISPARRSFLITVWTTFVLNTGVGGFPADLHPDVGGFPEDLHPGAGGFPESFSTLSHSGAGGFPGSFSTGRAAFVVRFGAGSSVTRLGVDSSTLPLELCIRLFTAHVGCVTLNSLYFSTDTDGRQLDVMYWPSNDLSDRSLDNCRQTNRRPRYQRARRRGGEWYYAPGARMS